MISLPRSILRVFLNFLYRFNKLNVSLSKFIFSRMIQSLSSILWRKFCKNVYSFFAVEPQIRNAEVQITFFQYVRVIWMMVASTDELRLFHRHTF